MSSWVSAPKHISVRATNVATSFIPFPHKDKRGCLMFCFILNKTATETQCQLCQNRGASCFCTHFPVWSSFFWYLNGGLQSSSRPSHQTWLPHTSCYSRKWSETSYRRGTTWKRTDILQTIGLRGSRKRIAPHRMLRHVITYWLVRI